MYFISIFFIANLLYNIYLPVYDIIPMAFTSFLTEDNDISSLFYSVTFTSCKQS